LKVLPKVEQIKGTCLKEARDNLPLTPSESKLKIRKTQKIAGNICLNKRNNVPLPRCNLANGQQSQMNPTHDTAPTQQPQDVSMMAGEPAVTTCVDRFVASDTLQAFMHDFVYANYTPERAAGLESQNFLVGTPFTYDHVETEEDWERIEREAEESGVATPVEVKTVFDRWLNL